MTETKAQLSAYEAQVLQAISDGSVAYLRCGAALNSAVEALQGHGYLTRRGHVTPEGRRKLAAAIAAPVLRAR